MKYVSKLLVGLAVICMLAGSVSAQNEMTPEEAVQATIDGEWIHANHFTQEEGLDWEAIKSLLKPHLDKSRMVARRYVQALSFIKTDDPVSVEKEIKALAEKNEFSPYKRLQTLARSNGDQAFKKRILAESIDAGYVNKYYGIRLAKQVDDPMQAEAVKLACSKYSNRADLLKKGGAIKLLLQLKDNGVISLKDALKKAMAVQRDSTGRYQTLSEDKAADFKPYIQYIGSIVEDLKEEYELFGSNGNQ